MRYGPARHNAVVDFSDFYADDEMSGALAHSFLHVLHQLACVLAEVHIDSFSFCLQDAVLVYQYESHSGQIIIYC